MWISESLKPTALCSILSVRVALPSRPRRALPSRPRTRICEPACTLALLLVARWGPLGGEPYPC
jgi:hypothetical protein